MFIVFTYFHQIVGPSVFLSVPSNLPAQNKENILKLMDIETPHGFFEFRERSGYANYKFEIVSALARGKKDLLMLSIVIGEKANLLIFNSILIDIAKKVENISDVYELFYEKEEQYTPEQQAKRETIRQLLTLGSQEIEARHLNMNFGDVLILGNDKAGKDSIIDRLINDDFNPQRRSTMSFQIIKTVFENVKFSLFDLGGKENNRELWYKACKKPRAIIYVLDLTSNDETLALIQIELHKIIRHFKLEQSNNNIPLLIMGNKCEIASQVTEQDLVQKLQMKEISFPYHIGLVSAKENRGIEPCFKWLIVEFLK